MTLRVRNKFFLALDIVSALVFSVFLAAFIYFILVIGLPSVPSFSRLFPLCETNVLIKNSPLAAMISKLVMPFYVTIFGLFMYLSFEKTKAQELVYIALYFVGCAMQGISILIATLQMWETSSIMLIFIGKIALAGQILSIVSILILTLVEGSENADVNETYTDRNVWIGLSVSLFCASVMPINTTKIYSAFWCSTGFDVEIFVLFIMIMIVSIVFFACYTYKNGLSFFRGPALYVALLECGYLFLSQCDNFLFLIIGTVLLFSSTYILLSLLRQKYLWS